MRELSPQKNRHGLFLGRSWKKKYDFWTTRNEELTIQVTLILAQFSFSCLSDLIEHNNLITQMIKSLR